MFPTPTVALLERGVVETSSLPLTPRLRGQHPYGICQRWQLPVSWQAPVMATAGAVSPLVNPAHAGIEAPTLPFERVGLARKSRHCQQSAGHCQHWQLPVMTTADAVIPHVSPVLTHSSLWRERGWQERPGTTDRAGTTSNS